MATQGYPIAAGAGWGGTSLVLPQDVRRGVIAHARRAAPRECCGLLIGRGRHVSGALAVRNLAPGTMRYEIDPRAHIDARRVLRQIVPPLEILGVYHSHPAGRARPSTTDIAEALYPDWVYLIVGLGGARVQVAAFAIRRGRALPVKLVAAEPDPR
jgi:proteasome lid subunit RPN8/RPN11